jgi:hypothetical protein
MKLIEVFENLTDNELFVGDVFSVGVLLASFFSVLPNIATLLTVVWMALRIWETDTVRGLTGRKHKRDDAPPPTA